MNRTVIFLGTLAGVSLMLMATGCDDGMQPTSGMVRFTDGEPIPRGRIRFHPVAGGRMSTGRIKEGKFVVNTKKMGDGLPVGEYKVTFDILVADKDNPMQTSYSMALKYLEQEKTPISVTVTDDKHEFDFEIQRFGQAVD